MNPDTIGCVWTGEFDLNTLRVDGEIFESGKKKLRIQKYPDTFGRGLSMNREANEETKQTIENKYLQNKLMTKLYRSKLL